MESPAASKSQWFRRFHPRPDAEAALVCLPYAGGSASAYFSLSELLAEEVDVLSTQYPGRQNRFHEPCLESVRDLARGAFEVLDPLIAGRPFALLGHSMGAAVGFELARLLEREGPAAPLALFASGRRAPSIGGDRGVRFLDDEGIVAELRSLEGTDGRILDEPELLRLLLPSVRADYIASETYDAGPGAIVGCDVVALAGDRDAHVGVDEVAEWRDHTTGTFGLKVFPGGHFFLTDHEPEIASLVTDTLRAATRPGHPIR
ncbi:thioesterase II family protein [Streptomyces sp. NPDC059092]|uniref:thioesterase II family protein n=1 Tax=Streptomyces sp. NPDC059092 TaxID=3346725 RepID=UPI0036A42B89